MRKTMVLLITFFVPFLTTSAQTEQINDGPYVTIINDTTVQVQYVYHDSLVEFDAYGSGLITFQGRGYDSLNSYTVSTRHQVPSIHYESASKLFFFSDPHGEFEYLSDLLINNNIIDSNLNWSFGDGHLVVNGDILDRGDKCTEIMWMIYRLEQEAEKAGGMVHYVLGNHEIMPLQKDLRYIHPKYIDGTCKILDKSYDELFGKETVFGEWLRSKNICEIVNGILFVHGGLNPTVMEKGYTLEYINKTMRENIDTPRDSIKADSALSYLFRGFGPVWYRGYHYDMDRYKQATEAQIDSLLGYYDATNIVVGHTVKDSTAVLYGGKVFGVNQDYEIREEYEGLYWADGKFYACDINGRRRQLNDGQ